MGTNSREMIEGTNMERFLRGGFRQETNLESINESEDVGDVNGDQSSVSHYYLILNQIFLI